MIRIRRVMIGIFSQFRVASVQGVVAPPSLPVASSHSSRVSMCDSYGHHRAACVSGSRRQDLIQQHGLGFSRKGTLASYEEFEAIGLCVSGCRAAEIQVDFTEGHTTDPSAVCKLRKSRCNLFTLGNQEVQRWGVIQLSRPHERSPYAPTFEDSCQEET